MAAASCTHTQEKSELDSAFRMLRQGGNIIVMRHATSPAGQKAAIGLTEGCTLAARRVRSYSRGGMKSGDPEVAEAFGAELETGLAAAPSSNILLVTHSNITPLYWSGPLEGGEETPSGRVHIVRKLTAPDGSDLWEVVRIDIEPQISAPEISGVRDAVGSGQKLNQPGLPSPLRHARLALSLGA